MKFRELKHLPVVALVAVGLTLAACGGGGGSGLTTDVKTPPTTEPPPKPTPVAVTLPSDSNAYLDDDDTTLADGTFTIAAGGTETRGAYTFTCGDAACTVTVADGSVTATGDVSAAYSTAAMTTINTAKMAMTAQTEGRALGMHSALTDTTTPPTRGEGIRPATTTKGDDFDIARGMSGGAMVSNKTVGWETADAGTSISGWAGKVVSRGTQSYTVYTDIAAAKRKSFLTAYANNTAATDLVGAEVTVGTGDNAGQLNLNAAAMIAAAGRGLLDSSEFPEPPEPNKATKTYTYSLNKGDTSGDSGDRFKAFTGTFHGATGKYTCTDGTECTVSVTAPSTQQRATYAASGDWTFTPDTKNNPQIIAQDPDHMHFGWWLNDPAKAAVGGEYLYDAQVFSGGSQAFPAAKITATGTAEAPANALHGKVNYEGPAAGLYAVTGDDAAHGEFTATAKLTADFGTAEAAGVSVSGTIGSFKRDDNAANDWALTLSTATSSESASASGNIVDGSKKMGGWNYTLFGPGGTGNVPPTGIAGTFDAKIDKNTAVAGAFGAK